MSVGIFDCLKRERVINIKSMLSDEKNRVQVYPRLKCMAIKKRFTFIFLLPLFRILVSITHVVESMLLVKSASAVPATDVLVLVMGIRQVIKVIAVTALQIMFTAIEDRTLCWNGLSRDPYHVRYFILRVPRARFQKYSKILKHVIAIKGMVETGNNCRINFYWNYRIFLL